MQACQPEAMELSLKQIPAMNLQQPHIAPAFLHKRAEAWILLWAIPEIHQ